MEVSMKDYTNLLLRAINNYNDNDDKSKMKLRDLVCIISDDEKQKEDPVIRELLYIASQKMRVFGYNVQNGFYRKGKSVNMTASSISLLSDAAILQQYQSKVRPNNFLDKSQQDVIDHFQSLEKRRMLVSAPTSYGKTFIMREILFLNHKKYRNVLLVFPTVALLRENALNMEEMNRGCEMGYHVIKSIDSEIDVKGQNIFVFTPERAMQLMANYPNIRIDFFFYDEMYKIDEDLCVDELDEQEDEDKKNAFKGSVSFLDEARAKTFRICLYLLSRQVEDYYLAGPNLKKKQFGYGMQAYIKNNNISVVEIEFEPTKRIQVEAYGTKINENYLGMEYLENPQPKTISTKKNDKICDIVKYIADKEYGSTLLYCTNPGKANEYAKKLSNNHQGKVITDEKFEMFLKHLRRNYNINNSINEWSFVSVLEKGFGMHHGQLPKYIQKEVLDLFNRGVFELLFCTTTIVEGVNTDAKNMVVLNHTKGSVPLTTFDFKNIIGRAGRYYHSFIGRYFLVDKELKELEDSENLTLDFITYSEKKLDAIDIDNANMDDLSSANKEIKEIRIEMQKEYLLPENVFQKNRLIKKENQETLLRYLLNDKELFDKFYKKTNYSDILLQFTKYQAINAILDIFFKANLIEEPIMKRYKAISRSYCEEGFVGILKYELKRTKTPDKYGNIRTVDNAYMAAFKTQKEILEHKIPKMLALFESIFVHACSIKNMVLENFSLSKVIRFYETGVKSYFGEQLIEYGYPVDAIRRIEKRNPILVRYGADETKKFIRDNLQRMTDDLDRYEEQLLYQAIRSIF